MQGKNETAVSEFTLLGLSSSPAIEKLLSLIFLFIYIATLSGNLLLIAIIYYAPHFHSPMYVFIGQLSFLDICYCSVTVPKMLVNLLAEKKTISFPACFAQLHFFLHFACTESLILSAMAYDRYVAICYPLHYTRIINRRVCLLLLATSWAVSGVYAMVHTCSTSRLSFCGSGIINHFFCDLPALLRITCSDPTSHVLGVLLSGGLIGFSSLLVMLCSYASITGAILKIPSAPGRQKAFSTCVTHLVIVSLFYGTFSFAYFQTLSNKHREKDAQASVFYTTVTPMLNPFIYAFRNTEIKVFLVKWCERFCRPRGKGFA